MPAYLFIEDILHPYLRECGREKKISTQEAESSCAARLEEFFGGYWITNHDNIMKQTIDGSTVRRYREYRKLNGISPLTVKRELAVASAACNYMRSEKDMEIPNPFAGRLISKKDERAQKPREIRVITEGEESRLILAADPLTADIIRVAIGTGLRMSELLNLTWDQIQSDEIHFHPDQHKGGTWARCGMSKVAFEAIQRQPAICEYVFHLNGMKINRRALHTLFDRARKAAKVECTFHDLRRTCGSRIREHAALDVASAQLRHADVRTTRKWYADDPIDRVKDAVRKL